MSVAIGLHEQYISSSFVPLPLPLGENSFFSQAFAFPKAAVSRGVGFLHESILLSVYKRQHALHCMLLFFVHLGTCYSGATFVCWVGRRGQGQLLNLHLHKVHS